MYRSLTAIPLALAAYMIVFLQMLARCPGELLMRMIPVTVLLMHVLVSQGVMLLGSEVCRAKGLPLREIAAPPHAHLLIPVNLITSVALCCRECGRSWRLPLVWRVLDVSLAALFCVAEMTLLAHASPEPALTLLLTCPAYLVYAYLCHGALCRLLRRSDDLTWYQGQERVLYENAS